MNYQWYPGHMTKARRQMQEDLKLIDLMIELVDARVPAASRNPDIDELGKNKARLILLNKSDLADERGNDAWMEYFKGKGYSVVKVNSRSGAGMKAINSAVQEACKEKIERDRKRGSRLLAVARAEDVHARHSPQPRELFHGLMSGSVLAHAYGVVREYIEHGEIHECAHAHGAFEVVGEHEERRAVGAQSAVEHYAVAGRRHGKFAYAKVHICAVSVVLGIIGLAL